MIERNAKRVQAERRNVNGVGLCVAELMIWQIGLFALDRPAEVPQVDANLVGTSGDWPRFDERCAVGKTVEQLKLCASRCAIVVDGAAAEPGGVIANRRVACE